MKTKRTPTPWNNDLFPFAVDGKDGILIADCSDIACRNDEVQNANAEHIVRCVNSHDELVEACNHVIDNLSQESEEAWEVELSVLRQALKHAEV